MENSLKPNIEEDIPVMVVATHLVCLAKKKKDF